jgi:hypothetical protein
MLKMIGFGETLFINPKHVVAVERKIAEKETSGCKYYIVIKTVSGEVYECGYEDLKKRDKTLEEVVVHVASTLN